MKAAAMDWPPSMLLPLLLLPSLPSLLPLPVTLLLLLPFALLRTVLAAARHCPESRPLLLF